MTRLGRRSPVPALKGPVGDPNFASVVALLHCDGSDGGIFTDSSPLGANWNPPVSAISTGTAQFGVSSIQIVTNSYIQASAASSNFAFGSGDFTIEMWVYALVFPTATNYLYDGRPVRTQGFYPSIYCDASGVLNYFTNSAARITATGSPMSANAWHHVAVSKVSGSTKMFLDGTQVGSTYTDSNTYLGAQPLLGGYDFVQAQSFSWTGYLDEARITKGVGRYASNFTPSAVPFDSSDPSYSSVVALLHGDGVGGSTVFTDSGPLAANWVNSQAGPLISTAQAKFGSSSAFITPNHYIYATAAATNFTWGTSDFTIEMWVYSLATQSNTAFIYLNGGTGATPSLSFSATNVPLWTVSGIGVVITGTAISNNAWHHIAISRVSGSTKMFIDGTQAGSTYTDANSYTAPSANAPIIGTSSGNIFPFNGHIDEICFTKGVGRYTSNFTPPSAPYDNTDANYASMVALLHCEDINRSIKFADTSPLATNWNAFTGAGLSNIQSKFGGASAAFGLNGYITPNVNPANFAFGTNNFTIEMWIYVASVTGTQFIYDGRPAATTGFYPQITLSTTTLNYNTNNAIKITAASAVSIGNWYHIAVCRIGTNTKMFVNGTQVGSTFVDSSTYLNTLGRPLIGMNSNNTISSQAWQGEIDEVRITNGVGRYAANFTAPTAPFPSTPLYV